MTSKLWASCFRMRASITDAGSSTMLSCSLPRQLTLAFCCFVDAKRDSTGIRFVLSFRQKIGGDRAPRAR
jgi:hypothetical protein